MEIKELEPGFSVCHAVYPDDLAEIKRLGFRWSLLPVWAI